MPGYLMMLKIANNSPSRYTINFSNLFKNWDLINQYLWGKIIKTIKQEIQFKFTLNLNIVTEGSNEENRLDILKKKLYPCLTFEVTSLLSTQILDKKLILEKVVYILMLKRVNKKIQFIGLIWGILVYYFNIFLM